MSSPNESLRFTAELKDLFTETWEHIVESAKHGSETIKSSIASAENSAGEKISGLTKGLALVSTGAVIGTAIFSSWTNFKEKISETIKEADALKATLGNIIGSKGAAAQVIEDLNASDLTKVFNIKDIDEAYTHLADHGLKATLAQMTSIGDLSANTGKSVNATTEAIIHATEGRFEQLKTLGIEVVRHHETISKKGERSLVMGMSGMKSVKGESHKEKIDDITFSFRGQTETVKNNTEAIRNYLLNLGLANGVQGSMANMTDTLAAKDNNLNNELQKLWETMGERLKPTVVETKGVLTKMVATVREWFEIPIEKKVADEITKIKILQTELTSTNTTEERRKTILGELKDINPEITKGIDEEAISYGKLADNIDKVVSALQQKAIASKIEKKYSDLFSDYTDLEMQKQKKLIDIRERLYQLYPDVATDSNLSDEQKMAEAQQRIDLWNNRSDADVKSGVYDKSPLRPAGDRYETQFFHGDVGTLKNINDEQSKLKPKYDAAQKEISYFKSALQNATGTMSIDKIAGGDKPPGAAPTKPTTNIDRSGISGVNGGGQIKNIVVNINHLISGGVNLHATTIKEGIGKAKDIVLEAFTTMVNDANLAGD